MNNTGFKLIAIEPLSGCAPDFLKILKVDEIYYLYQNYTIERDKDGNESIVIREPLFPRVYDVGGLSVNVSAIVGKNGAGKSSLVELIYVVYYNIAKHLKIIPKKDDKDRPYDIVDNIHVAIYFTIDEVVYKLVQKGWENNLYQYNTDNGGLEHMTRVDKPAILETCFYSIVVNYSHYSLNELEIGHWVRAIFHKNDGYQTPIVLNPYRENGNIDINTENFLVRSRLLSNILQVEGGTLWVGDAEKRPSHLRFKIDRSKFQISKKTHKIVLTRTAKAKRYFIPTVYEIFFGDPTFKPSEGMLNDLAIEYIINKLFSIMVNYKHYYKYRGFAVQKSNSKLTAYLTALKADHSHVTFKLRQALNFLRFDILPKDLEVLDYDVAVIAYNIREVHEDHDIPTIELIPPAFLTVDIAFSNYDDLFSKLSSGEKQKIYAAASLIYHLKNLESIIQNPKVKGEPTEKLLRFFNINIVFDEIELYFHPDLQRRFIDDLLKNLRSANIRLIKSLNMIFVTHSPFILSDIPQEQTLYLDVEDRKASQRLPLGNTFGGNVHDLLSNSFFLNEDGYMGEFAKSLINDVYYFLYCRVNPANNDAHEFRRKWTQTEVRQLIDMIGESLIRDSLNSLYTDVFLRTRSAIDEEINRLEKLKTQVPN